MASGSLDPVNHSEAWSTVYVFGKPSPGVAIVGEFKRKQGWDIKTGKGTSGATLTLTAQPPAKGSIVFQAWIPYHFISWETFYQLLSYQPGKQAAQAIDIRHPALLDLNITSVVTEAIGSWVHRGEGLYERTVELIEYKPAPKKSVVSTPTMAKAEPPKGADPTMPFTPIQAALEQAKELNEFLVLQAQGP